uniref:Uncharacterized protein TCIL3000_10_10260 n=1 Tax=Trypanosoma congolense (strain IL3000) TaxID=1068625 RepID=G0UXY0_TRYCI|nr:unnamed protein product [Trypanosoma congolense IL3000]
MCVLHLDPGNYLFIQFLPTSIFFVLKGYRHTSRMLDRNTTGFVFPKTSEPTSNSVTNRGAEARCGKDFSLAFSLARRNLPDFNAYGSSANDLAKWSAATRLGPLSLDSVAPLKRPADRPSCVHVALSSHGDCFEEFLSDICAEDVVMDDSIFTYVFDIPRSPIASCWSQARTPHDCIPYTIRKRRIAQLPYPSEGMKNFPKHPEGMRDSMGNQPDPFEKVQAPQRPTVKPSPDDAEGHHTVLGSPPSTPIFPHRGSCHCHTCASPHKLFSTGEQEDHQKSLVAPISCSIRWQRGKCIGRGSTSVVYAAVNLDTAEMLAVKVLESASCMFSECSLGKVGTEASSLTAGSCVQDRDNDNDALINSFLHEFYVLKKLSHPCVVHCLGAQVTSDVVCIIMECLAGGRLKDVIKHSGGLPESIVRLYTRQILEGVEYLQSCGVVHGDIKSDNLLLSESGRLKICDFGMSHFKGVLHSEIDSAELKDPDTTESGNPDSVGKCLCGTPLYMSPELIRTQESTFASDIWGLGCVVYEMITGSPPWEELHDLPPVTTVWRIGAVREGPNLQPLKDRGASPALLDFVSRSLHMDPAERATVGELLRHPFIVEGEFTAEKKN